MRALIAVLLLLVLAGCTAPKPRGAGPDAAPPDFSLVFTVMPDVVGEPVEAFAPDPLLRPAQHIIAPDRVLRVAFGSRVHPGLFPSATATLSPAQVDRLWRIIRDQGLMIQPPPGPASSPLYTIHLTASGQQSRYTTSANASPGATELLQELVRLRGDRLGEPPTPSP